METDKPKNVYIPDWCSPELFDEIAGILEHDAKLSRHDAETKALEIIYNMIFM